MSKYTLNLGLKQLKSVHPDPLWAKENKGQMMVYFDQTLPSAKGFSFYTLTSLRPVVATLVVLGLLLSTSVGTIFASQNSLPGQKLYTVKRLTEGIRLAFVFDKTEKNVLRSELLNTRVQEAGVLARKVQTAPDAETEQNLVSTVKEIKDGVGILQKEILSQTNVAVPVKIDVTASEGSLPVQDGKKMAQMILSEDLKKSLEETKNLLAKKDLTTALAKTVELDKQLTGQDNVRPINVAVPENKAGLLTPAGSAQPLEPKEQAIQPISPIEPKPALRQESGAVGSVSIPPDQEKSDDFKISPTRESDIKTDLIREK